MPNTTLGKSRLNNIESFRTRNSYYSRVKARVIRVIQ